MKKTRFTEAQIVVILKELDGGTPATELARKHAIHANTIRLWRDKYAGMQTSDLVHMKQLEANNARMQRIIARQTLELDAVKDLISKKRLGPAQRKEAVVALHSKGLSKFRACTIVGQPYRSLFNKPRPEKRAHTLLKECIGKHAQERPRFGWRRLLILARREIPGTGEFRFRRLYKALGLQVRPRKKRKVNYVRGNTVSAVSRPNERWSIDFMHDCLANGRNFRTMNIIDDFTSECLALETAFSFGSYDVTRCFDAIAFERGLPQTVRFDNGPEFTSRAMLQWGAEQRVELHLIQPGKPTQNAKIELLNGKIRDELLNAHAFAMIEEARSLADAWKKDYNETRPHSSLGGLTPLEHANKF